VIVGEPFDSGDLPVVVCNDTRESVEVDYRISDGESDGDLSSGTVRVPAGRNWLVALIPVHAGVPRLLILRWTVEGESFGNHYTHARPPVSFDRYRRWIEAIAAVDGAFDPDAAAR